MVPSWDPALCHWPSLDSCGSVALVTRVHAAGGSNARNVPVGHTCSLPLVRNQRRHEQAKEMQIQIQAQIQTSHPGPTCTIVPTLAVVPNAVTWIAHSDPKPMCTMAITLNCNGVTPPWKTHFWVPWGMLGAIVHWLRRAGAAPVLPEVTRERGCSYKKK